MKYQRPLNFQLMSDYGFCDTQRLKDRYTHGGASMWEIILPFAEIRCGV